jgi:LPS export ABC transporter permease LptG/LPS export ABC transporter permease LptF
MSSRTGFFLLDRFSPLLFRAVVRELRWPILVTLIGLTMLMLTKELLGFSDLVLNRGFGVGTVAAIAMYELVPIATRTLPFAVLVGVLVGLGRLRADLEILAIEAAGVAYRWLLAPVLTCAVVATLVGLLPSLFLAPWATWSLATSLRAMAEKNPGLMLRAGTVHDFSGVKMVAREVSARGDRLRGVLLWAPERGQTIFAERGELIALGGGSSQVALHDGVLLRTPRVRGEETRFETFWQTLQDSTPAGKLDNHDFTGATLTRLTDLARDSSEHPDVTRRARVEFHRRFAAPFACIAFALLAAPIAAAGSRFSRAAGGVTGLLIAVIYYSLVQFGDGLTQAGVLGPVAGVWLPNLAVVAAAVVFLLRENLGPLWAKRTRLAAGVQTRETLNRAVQAPLPRFVLARYVARQYLQLLGIAFAVLLVGYLLVDVLERLQWFARYHADASKVLRFYGARLPLLASRIIPMALLLATALTVSFFSVQRELTGLRACGVSAVRALLPLLLLAGGIAPGYFALNEVIVPRTNAWADQLKEQEIKERALQQGPLEMMIWYRTGSHVYQAAQLDPQLGEAKELSIYDLGENGLPVSRTDARAAKYIGKGVWELVDPVRIEISEHGLRETPGQLRAQLGEAPTETLDTMHLSVRALMREIHAAETNGYDATTYRVDVQAKLAAPVACLLLPTVALLFAVGGPPFPGPAVTLLVSGVLGVGHVLLTGVCASLGYGGVLFPLLAGWGPSLGYTVLAGVLARRNLG